MSARRDHQVARHFGDVAPGWIDRYADRPSFRHRLDVVGDVVSEVVGRFDPCRVLDFGGGPGMFSLLASGGAASVLCLDTSLPMVQAGAVDEADAVALLVQAGHEPVPARVWRAVGPLEALRQPPVGAFDVVLAIAVLEYLPDPAATLTALGGRLRRGGRLVMTVPDERSWFRRIEGLVGSLGARAGTVVGSERLTSRAYATTRPHGNRVPWRAGADVGGLVVERSAPLALAGSGLLARTRPSRIVVLRQRDPPVTDV